MTSFKDALLAFINTKSDAERKALEPKLKKLRKWQTLPPMSVLRKMAELLKSHPSIPAPVKLYHRTTAAAAKSILADGFRDAKCTYGSTRMHRGVWLSDVPLDVNEGADGDILLCVTLACDGERIQNFEWVEVGKPYREWLVPAVSLKPLISSIEIVTRLHTSG